MMRWLCLCLMLFAIPAWAQQQDQVVLVDKAACRYVTRHIPDASVEYKPGVDVHGKKVAPADIEPPQDYGITDSFYMKLDVDAAKLFGLKVPNIAKRNQNGTVTKVPAVTPDSTAGYITLKNGKAYLNDRPLDPDAESQLAVLCKSHRGKEHGK